MCVSVYVYIYIYIYIHIDIHIHEHIHISFPCAEFSPGCLQNNSTRVMQFEGVLNKLPPFCQALSHMGWHRLVGFLNDQFSFVKETYFYWVLLRKRHAHLGSLRIATSYET